MERSKRTARAGFWQNVLKQFAESKLSVVDFCSQKGLMVHPDCKWEIDAIRREERRQKEQENDSSRTARKPDNLGACQDAVQRTLTNRPRTVMLLFASLFVAVSSSLLPFPRSSVASEIFSFARF